MERRAMLSSLREFDFQPRTRIVFGEHALDRLGELAHELGIARALLTTDAGIVAAGHATRALDALRAHDIKVCLFDQVCENPTSDVVAACADVGRAGKVDGVIGLGGGSAMDAAKGANFLITNGGVMRDYWGYGKAARPLLPMIAAPTTAGTGSECQSYALISDAETHQKMACGDAKACPRIALLDPTLTLTQPRHVAVQCGIDAIAHAVESAVTQSRNAVSLLFAHRAFALCIRAFPRVLALPDDLAARADMLLGACWAGLAIEQSMLGAAHAAANPLTARYDLPHGLAVGMMLPCVVAYNAQDEAARAAYADLARHAGLCDRADDDNTAVERLRFTLDYIRRTAQLPASLRELGVSPGDIPALAAQADRQWTARHNPRPLDGTSFEQLYRQACE